MNESGVTQFAHRAAFAGFVVAAVVGLYFGVSEALAPGSMKRVSTLGGIFFATGLSVGSLIMVPYTLCSSIYAWCQSLRRR